MPEANLHISIPDTVQGYSALADFIREIGHLQNPLAEDRVPGPMVVQPPESKADEEVSTPPADMPADTSAPTVEETTIIGPNSVFNQNTAGVTPPAAPPPPKEEEISTPTVDHTKVLDSAGRPWDARINNKVQSKKADGEWKLIRGIDKALVASVHAEQAAAGYGKAPASAPPAADTTKAASTFSMNAQDVMNFIVKCTTEKTLKFDDVNTMLQKHDIDNMMLLPNHPDKLEVVYGELCNMQK